MDKKRIRKLIFRVELFYLLGIGASLVVDYHNLKENNPQAIVEELSDEGISLSVYDAIRGSGKVVSMVANSSEEKKTFDAHSLERLDQLVNNQFIDVDSLTIDGLSSEVDFSELALQDIDKISFMNIGDDFDYQDFAQCYFSDINFFHVSMNDHLKKFLADAPLDYADISVGDDDALPILNYLGSIDKEVRAVTISSFDDFDNVSKSLENIKARKVIINLAFLDDSKPFDLNLNLNDSVEDVILKFDCFVDAQNIKLGNISIHGKNDNLSIKVLTNKEYCAVTMDDKTKFDFPDHSLVTFEDITCENPAAFNSLANVDGLDFSDGEGTIASFTDETSHNRKVKYR